MVGGGRRVPVAHNFTPQRCMLVYGRVCPMAGCLTWHMYSSTTAIVYIQTKHISLWGNAQAGNINKLLECERHKRFTQFAHLSL